jgi:spoIIIJ-associated protein
MRDEVYSGRSVDEALSAASNALALPVERLRYVVLDAGGEAEGGREAKIAIMAEDVEALRQTLVRDAAPLDPRQAIEGIIAALGRAAGQTLDVEIHPEGKDLELRLSGPGRSLLLDRGARGLKALDHVLQRGFRRRLPGRLLLECEGHRERRQEELESLAHRLAEAARATGEEQTAPALNSYERRLVHLALTQEEGLTTFSRGDGVKRRLVIAPATSRPEAEAQTEVPTQED